MPTSRLKRRWRSTLVNRSVANTLQVHVHAWLASVELSPLEVDCITTVMLKIIDQKCKMSADEKALMTVLYDTVKTRPGKIFNDIDMHGVIAEARGEISQEQTMIIYEHRLMAETALSRPVMKKFKARLRDEGFFEIDERMTSGLAK